jgi:hypothetical protein
MGFLVSIIAAALELGLFQVALTMVAWLIIGAAGYDAAKRHNKTIWDKMPR